VNAVLTDVNGAPPNARSTTGWQAFLGKRPEGSTAPMQSWRAIARAVTVAVVLCLAAFTLQSLLWPLLAPFAWIIFAFTLLLSAWIGGTWSGICATVLSTALVWWRFLPLERLPHPEGPRYAISTGVFVLIALAFSAFQGHLRRATRDAAAALASARRANEELKRAVNERRVFAALVNDSADLIGIDDTTGKRLYLNPAGRRMVGLPDDYDVEQTSIPDYYPPDLRSFATDVVLKTVMERGAWQGETYLRNWRTGERIPVSNASFVIHDPDTGCVLGTGTITRDVSDMRRAREAIEEANAKLEGANEALRDSVTDERRREDEEKFLAEVGSDLARTLDYEETLSNVAHLAVRELADFCAIDVVEDDGNASRLRVVSRDPSKAFICELLRQVPLDRARPHIIWSVLESKRPLVLHGVTQALRSIVGEVPAYQEALRHVDVQALVSVPLVAHGKVLGAMSFVSSTPLRQYGPDDVRLAQELGVRAALAIENAGLYRDAQRAVKVRDDVLGVVAHDLRNPVNSILMQLHVLVRAGREPERRTQKPIRTIRRAALRMNHLISDLIDVARMEAGGLPIEPAWVSASQLVSESVEAQSDLAASTSLDLRSDAAQALPDVWADHERILQVFENLIGNSFKFTDPGGHVTVGAAAGQGEDVFWVSDTGRGITAEEMPHVFDRFWQASCGTKRCGAGLGLSIVKGIVEAHGGRVWVESERGRGTTFAFAIPTVSKAEPAERHCAR
jgi:PAS domain S-box-containing protein